MEGLNAADGSHRPRPRGCFHARIFRCRHISGGCVSGARLRLWALPPSTWGGLWRTAGRETRQTIQKIFVCRLRNGVISRVAHQQLAPVAFCRVSRRLRLNPAET